MTCEQCKKKDGAYWITDGKVLCSVCSTGYANDEVITEEGFHYMQHDVLPKSLVDVRGIIYIIEEDS